VPAAANPELVTRPKRRTFTAREKLRILEETDRAAGTGDIGARLILGFGVLDPVSGDQRLNQGAEQRLSPSAGIVNELKEAKVDREFLLRDATMRPQPGAKQ
jgi:hypothetical protein